MPQVWYSPLLIETNGSPSGGDAWPELSLPQQTGTPSSRSPQVCAPPLLLATNV